jgi:hypothetical protein
MALIALLLARALLTMIRQGWMSFSDEDSRINYLPNFFITLVTVQI